MSNYGNIQNLLDPNNFVENEDSGDDASDKQSKGGTIINPITLFRDLHFDRQH